MAWVWLRGMPDGSRCVQVGGKRRRCYLCHPMWLQDRIRRSIAADAAAAANAAAAAGTAANTAATAGLGVDLGPYVAVVVVAVVAAAAAALGVVAAMAATPLTPTGTRSASSEFWHPSHQAKRIPGPYIFGKTMKSVSCCGTGGGEQWMRSV